MDQAEKKRWVRRAAAAALIVLALVAAGCSSASREAADKSMSGGASGSSSAAPMESLAVAPQAAAVETAADSAAMANTAAKSAGAANTAATEEALGATGATPSAPADGYERKLIYKAGVTMEVESYARSQSEVRGMVAAAGGYILQFSEYNSEREKGGTYVLKVPAAGFVGLIDELERMQPISLQRSMQGQDVTEEYVDLAARLKAKQVVEARLLAFMEKAARTDELIAFSNELGKVQEEIERIKGRIRYLDQNVDYSTIELRMFEKLAPGAAKADGAPKPAVAERAWNAMKASGSVLASFFQGLIVVLAGALPVAAVLALIGIPAYYLARFLHRRTAKGGEPSPAGALPAASAAPVSPSAPADTPPSDN